MIVYTREDVVRLSGALVRNQWLTIKAAANLLLRDHPEGIIIDCSELEHVSEEGARTFLEAMKDIQAAGARIVVSDLPASVMEVVRHVPGVRSQLPLATSVAEARASLRMRGSARVDAAGAGILVPLMDGVDVGFAIGVAGRASRDAHTPIALVGLLVVARNLPLGAPLPDEEAAANRMLEEASQAARKQGLAFSVHLERVRDAQDGVLSAIRNYTSTQIVLGVLASRVDDDLFTSLIEVLLHRAPCHVVIARRAPDQSSPADGEPDQSTNAEHPAPRRIRGPSAE
jgi:anti-anti-sigma regulatory factor